MKIRDCPFCGVSELFGYILGVGFLIAMMVLIAEIRK